jgi:peroxiredoxin Q/BCP
METIRKFAAENGIDFPLVSDQGNAIRRKFGRGLVTYLIDKSGVIRFVQKGVPDNDNFLNALKKLR